VILGCNTHFETAPKPFKTDWDSLRPKCLALNVDFNV